MKRKILLAPLIVIAMLLVILLTGCTTENNSTYNFNVSKDFKVINSTVKEKNVQLIVSGDSDIDVYILTLKDHFKTDNLNFEIYIYDEDAKSFDISSNNFQDLRTRIDFNTNDTYYTENNYVAIPNMDNYKTILPFENEGVEIIDGVAICNIKIDGNNKIEDIISTAKTYVNEVKTLNKNITGVKVVINDEYKYEGNNYIIFMEKIDLL